MAAADSKTTPHAPKPTQGQPKLDVADLLNRKFALEAELQPINAALGILAGVEPTPKRGRPKDRTTKLGGITRSTYAVLEIVSSCSVAALPKELYDAHPEIAAAARPSLKAALARGYVTRDADGRYSITAKFAELKKKLLAAAGS